VAAEIVVPLLFTNPFTALTIGSVSEAEPPDEIIVQNLANGVPELK
jgi:hypothetical protein